MNPQKKKPLKIKCPRCQFVIDDAESLKKTNLFPFCSEKCKMSDLYGWFTEEFKVSRDIDPIDLIDIEEEM